MFQAVEFGHYQVLTCVGVAYQIALEAAAGLSAAVRNGGGLRRSSVPRTMVMWK
jgi:hypothetical protein